MEKIQHTASLNPPTPAGDAKIADAKKSLESARYASKSALDDLIQVTERYVLVVFPVKFPLLPLQILTN